jgi:hypothetical protein
MQHVYRQHIPENGFKAAVPFDPEKYYDVKNQEQLAEEMRFGFRSRDGFLATEA